MTTDLGRLCEAKLTDALVQFGEHSFFDKGPGEVMDTAELASRFRQAGVDESVAAFHDVLTIDRFGERLASAILYHLQEWDALWDAHGDFLGEIL